MSKRARRFASRAAALLGFAALVALVAYGWHRAQTLPLSGVEIAGAVHASPDALLALAAVPDSALLLAQDPLAIASRVEADPWVARARVSRRMTGQLRIAVTERQPVLLALGADGRPAAYLDASGAVMPVTASALRAGYDVPLLAGRLPALRPGATIEDAPLRRLLAVLPDVDPDADALISAIERQPDGQLVLVTVPGPAGAAIPVQLGRDGYAEKLRRLTAFWDQAVLSRPDHPVRRIDLRFAGQIVTDEGA